MGAPWLASGGDFEPALRVMAEARKLGLPFDDAWPVAVRAVDPADRTILKETAEAWKAEYEGRRAWGVDLVAALAVLDHDDRRHDTRIVA